MYNAITARVRRIQYNSTGGPRAATAGRQITSASGAFKRRRAAGSLLRIAAAAFPDRRGRIFQNIVRVRARRLPDVRRNPAV